MGYGTCNGSASNSTSRSSTTATVDVIGIDSEYFGDTMNLDPPVAPVVAKTTSKEAAFKELVISSNICHRQYKKSRKQNVLAEAVYLDDLELFLGK